MSIEYLDLADDVGIASEVTGLDEGVIAKIANLDLADSAPPAPIAEFGGEEFYPDFVDKAAVLIVRLARTILFRTATSESPGSRCVTSSCSTGGIGASGRLMTKRNEWSSRSLPGLGRGANGNVASAADRPAGCCLRARRSKVMTLHTGQAETSCRRPG